MPEEPSVNILIVDDEPGIADALGELLGTLGFQCTPTSLPVEALELCRTHTYDLLMADYAMPEMNGLELAHQVRAIAPNTAILLFTAYGSAFYQRDEHEPDVDAVVQKPVTAAHLAAVIRRTLRKFQERHGASPTPA